MKKYGIFVEAICDDWRIGEKLDGFLITDIANVIPSENLRIYITSGFNEAMEKKLKELDLDYAYKKIDFGRYEEEKENYNYPEFPTIF